MDGRRLPRRRDGDRRPAAAERLRLGVADAAGAAARPRVRQASATASRARSRSPRSRRRRRSRCFCFVKVVGLVLLGAAAARRLSPRPSEAPRADARRASSSSPLACVVLGVAPGLLFGRARRARALAAPARRRTPACTCPGPARCRRSGSRSCSSASPACSSLLRGSAAPRPPRRWACGQPSSRRLNWTSAGFTKPLRLVLEAVLRPQREIDVRSDGRRRAGGRRTAATCRT